jgi:GNAT superfamily N-acetyltransferase
LTAIACGVCGYPWPVCDDVNVDVHRLSASQVDEAGALLAERHRDHSPLGVSHVLANRTKAVAMVTAALEGGVGYAAMRGSTLAGFFVAPFPSMPGPTSARLGIADHAARVEESRSAYRSLYEVASGDLVAAGITYHSLPVLADHTAAVGTFFELEFGIDQIDGLLPLPSDSIVQSVSAGVRHATDADIDAVVDLAIELQRFHSRAPMFQAALGFDLVGIRRGVEAGIHDDRSIVVVVEGDDRLIGMAQAGPASAYVDTVDIGMNIITSGARSQGLGTAVLQYLLDWAASKRYRYCAVGWTSSNLISDAFYRSRGFTPVRFRLHRWVDPRILWANDTLDDSNFGHRRHDD